MRAWIRNLLKVKDTPEALARGLAVGLFFGASFFWGLQIALAGSILEEEVHNTLGERPMAGERWRRTGSVGHGEQAGQAAGGRDPEAGR